ncbi:serine hydrolase, partial [Calditrichota bacterium]
PDTLGKQFQSVLDNKQISLDLTGVSTAIIMPEKGAWSGASGMSDLVSGDSMQTDMLFWIASISKTFTAAITLQLVDEGLLSLEDSLHQWLPNYQNIDSNITIRQLLNHTSGTWPWRANDMIVIDTVLFDPNRYWSPDELMTVFVTPNLPSFPPGQGWEYNNTGYFLLGMIIEEVTQSELHIEFKNRFGNPLQLNNTHFIWSDTILTEYAHPWADLDGNGIKEDYNDFFRTAAWSIGFSRGNIISNPKDIAMWANYLYEGNVLSQSSMNEMLNFTTGINWSIPPWNGCGLGVAKFILYGKEFWGHNGNTVGYTTLMVYSPDYQSSIVIFMNDWGYNLQREDLAVELFKIIINYYDYPYDKVHPYKPQTNFTFLNVNSDTLNISSHVHNPDNHNVQVHAIIYNPDSTFIDSSLMFDDGNHGDILLGDGIYGCYFPPLSNEDMFSVHISTMDFDSSYNHILPEKDAIKFTTIGPVIFESYSITGDTIIDPGDNRKFQFTLHNASATATATNVTSQVVCLDTFATISTLVTSEYGDITAGARVTSSDKQYIRFSNYCTAAQQIPLALNIFGDGYQFWSDTFYVDINPSGLEKSDQSLPYTFVLKQNYPNPFNPNTTIEFAIPKPELVTLKIYNLLGQEVATLVNKKLTPGIYKYVWDASGFASSIYMYKIETGSFAQTRKFILMK